LGKLSRTKGHSFERDIAKSLRHIFPKARRHLEYQDGEANGVDLSYTGDFRIQCKRSKTSIPIKKIKEIQPDGIHLLVSKRDFEEEMVTMYWDDFLELLGKIVVKE